VSLNATSFSMLLCKSERKIQKGKMRFKSFEIWLKLVLVLLFKKMGNAVDLVFVSILHFDLARDQIHHI